MGQLRGALRSIQRLSPRNRFSAIANACDLRISYEANRRNLAILEEIFRKRAYSDYFPFYERATVVDVGAHCGLFAIFAALNVDPESRIIALEPSESNFRTLQRNLRDQAVDNVRALQAGIYSESTHLDLHLSAAPNHSIFDESTNPLSSTARTERIEVLSLADLITRHELDRIDFFKVDCEGAEYPALFKSDRETLGRIVTISMEFHDLKKPEHCGQAMARFLRGHGFRIVKFHYEPTSLNLNYGKIVATRDA